MDNKNAMIGKYIRLVITLVVCPSFPGISYSKLGKVRSDRRDLLCQSFPSPSRFQKRYKKYKTKEQRGEKNVSESQPLLLSGNNILFVAFSRYDR